MEHEIIYELLKQISDNNISKITFSNIRNKELELEKVIAKLVSIKNNINIQFEYRYKRVIKHTNIITSDSEAVKIELIKLFELAKDINIATSDENINIKISKKFKININRKKVNTRNISFNHNNKKEYFLDEKEKYPFLIELGIQNKALDQQYRQELDLICRNFTSLVLPQDKDENGNYLFSLVKNRKPELIESLYNSIYQLVRKYLLNHTDEQAVKNYFKFLVGNTAFEKVTLYAKDREIVIKDFSSVADATKIIE